MGITRKLETPMPAAPFESFAALLAASFAGLLGGRPEPQGRSSSKRLMSGKRL